MGDGCLDGFCQAFCWFSGGFEDFLGFLWCLLVCYRAMGDFYHFQLVKQCPNQLLLKNRGFQQTHIF